MTLAWICCSEQMQLSPILSRQPLSIAAVVVVCNRCSQTQIASQKAVEQAALNQLHWDSYTQFAAPTLGNPRRSCSFVTHQCDLSRKQFGVWKCQ